jgi:hypothetical protein
MSPLSGVLGEAWQLYRRYAAHFLVISFVIYVIAAILVALLSDFAGLAGTIIAAIIDIFATFLIQAALVKAVQDVRDGQVDMDLRQTVKAAAPFVLPVAAASIMAGIGIVIGFAIVIVPGLILLTFWSLIVPAIVIGGAGVFESFGRSWRTVRGFAWPVFGTFVLVFLIWVAFRIVLGLVFVALPVFPRYFIADVVAGTLFTPFLALVVTLIYYRLTAAHEAQAAGATAGPAGGGWAAPGPGPGGPGPAGPGPAGPGPGPAGPGPGGPAPGGPGPAPGGPAPGGPGPADPGPGPAGPGPGGPGPGPAGPGPAEPGAGGGATRSYERPGGEDTTREYRRPAGGPGEPGDTGDQGGGS